MRIVFMRCRRLPLHSADHETLHAEKECVDWPPAVYGLSSFDGIKAGAVADAGATPQEFGAFIKAEHTRWADIVKTANLALN